MFVEKDLTPNGGEKYLRKLLVFNNVIFTNFNSLKINYHKQKPL